MLSANTILRDRYRIIHQLGHGGMGAVYQAMDENLSCVVAVKETFATTDEQRRAFRREAELLANLSHPAFPRVMDHFTHGEGQFLVMQFVPGHDLAELLEIREQPFSVAKVIEWADQLLDALEELHSSNPPIIHRDIKPSNLKVTPKGKVLLLDFGLAKGAAGQMSTADVDSRGKSVHGYTPNYAPLEQIRGGGTDPRSDLYSLAATLWTLLTGKVPPDALSRVAEKEEGNPDPLRSAHELNEKVPLPFANVLQRAMSINRNLRQATAGELRSDLHDVREASFEPPTLPLEQPNALASTSLPPTPPLKGTLKAPDPASKSSPSDPHVPTMRVDSPPAVPSWDRDAASSTSNSLGGEADRPGYPRRRAVLLVASALVLAISIGLFAWSGWRPWVSAHPTAPPGMAYVPGGEFIMGRDDGDEYERPAHKVVVKPFFIDLYEVTREDYKKCVDAKKCPSPPGWINDNYPDGTARQPVTGVSWNDANEYARSAGKRLPTEEEWEFAARGQDGRRYPWGNDWKQGLANANGASGGLAEVGAYSGVSPFGAFDMVGNAWEWTASDLKEYPGGHLPNETPSEVKVVRGGSYVEKENLATATYRGFLKMTGDQYDKTGFRCVKDVGR